MSTLHPAWGRVVVAGAVLVALAATPSGCAAPGEPADLGAEGDARHPLAAVRFFVTRPYRVIPERDPFEEGAIDTFTEALVRDGYDVMGTADEEPGGTDDIREHLVELNARRPGTAAVHVTLVEAPSLVGFGKEYTRIHCAVYGPAGQVLLDQDLPLPERRALLAALIWPRLRPDADGRSWGARVWQGELAPLFPRRGP